jgi:hypothetical protein
MKSVLRVVFALVLSVSLHASASIVMRVDTENENFYFEGSDTGNAEHDSELEMYTLRFHTAPTGPTSVTSTENINVGASFAETAGQSFTFMSRLPYSYLDLDLYPVSDITTLTADPGVKHSYASWGADHKALLEGNIGGVLPLISGSGYSDISIQTVPEPSVIGLVALVGGGLFAVRRIFML